MSMWGNVRTHEGKYTCPRQTAPHTIDIEFHSSRMQRADNVLDHFSWSLGWQIMKPQEAEAAYIDLSSLAPG